METKEVNTNSASCNYFEDIKGNGRVCLANVGDISSLMIVEATLTTVFLTIKEP